MKGIIIALSVIAFIAALLFIPIHIRLKYSDSFVARIRVLFLTFPLYPSKKKPKKKRAKGKKKQKKKTDEAKTEGAPEKKKKLSASSVKGLIRLVYAISKIIISRFACHLKTKIYRIYIKIGSDDMAKTAVEYGAAAQGMAYLIEFLSQKTSVKLARNSIVRVEPDFMSERFSAAVDIDFSLRIWQIFDIGLKAVMHLIKNKMGSLSR